MRQGVRSVFGSTGSETHLALNLEEKPILCKGTKVRSFVRPSAPQSPLLQRRMVFSPKRVSDTQHKHLLRRMVSGHSRNKALLQAVQCAAERWAVLEQHSAPEMSLPQHLKVAHLDLFDLIRVRQHLVA